MAVKLTPEERAQKKAAKIVADMEKKEQYHKERKIARDIFLAGLTQRLIDARKLAGTLNVATHVDLVESGPSVRFEYEDHTRGIYIDATISHASEECDMGYLETRLWSLKTEQDAFIARFNIAQAVYNRLTDDEKFALKENFNHIRK